MALLLLCSVLLATGCELPEPDGDATPIERTASTQPVALEAAVATDRDREAFDAVMAYAREADLHERPIGEIVQAVGMR